MSAESGLATFRGSDGLWEGHRVEDVATPEAWKRNPALVLDFYNKRRRGLLDAGPNRAHRALAELEKAHDVVVITQNVDDLHERGGSTHVVHLHGELLKARSTLDPTLVYDLKGSDINIGDKCERGSQLRPHIVWFGEAVPLMDTAAAHAAEADILIVAGTSLVVYPAAGLIEYVPEESPVFVVDPGRPAVPSRAAVEYIEERASAGVPPLVERLMSDRIDGGNEWKNA